MIPLAAFAREDAAGLSLDAFVLDPAGRETDRRFGPCPPSAQPIRLPWATRLPTSSAPWARNACSAPKVEGRRAGCHKKSRGPEGGLRNSFAPASGWGDAGGEGLWWIRR